MIEIKNAASNQDDAVRLLQDGELDAVNGGVVPGDQGCIGPWRLPDGTITTHQPMGPNPWLPGGFGRG